MSEVPFWQAEVKLVVYEAALEAFADRGGDGA